MAAWRRRYVVTRLLAAAMLALAWTAAPFCPAEARTQTVRVTSGDHPSYSRLVLDAPGLTYTVNRDGGTLLIRFAEGTAIGNLPPAPRNILAMREVSGGVELTVAPGATVRSSRMGGKVVIDVDDSAVVPYPDAPTPGMPKREAAMASGDKTTASTRPPASAAKPSLSRQNREEPAAVLTTPRTDGKEPGKASPPNQVPVKQDTAPPKDSGLPVATAPPTTVPNKSPLDPAQAPTPVPASGQTEQTGSPVDAREDQAEPAQTWPVTRDPLPSGPVGIAAFKARPPSGLAGTAIQVPFPGQVGAALFTRGPNAFVVFDERRPIDLAALHDDPVFGSAVTTIYPAATVIFLTLPQGQSAMLSPAVAGWRVSVVPSQPRPAALTPLITSDGMTLAAEAPAQVVTIPDPQTGGPLMVGTQRASGQGVAVERRTPEFLLPVTDQGVVIVPLSDAVGLRITQAGFVLSGRYSGLVLSPMQPTDDTMLAAASLTRLFEFPRQTTENLAWRAKRQAIAAAAALPLTRGPFRRALAESLLGLGMGVEAQTLLRVTMKDDPREAASPVTIGLSAIAALLAGRFNEASDLADPRLTGTDEVAMWRAIQTAMVDEGSPKAAVVLAATAPLLLTYPVELRRRILPLALETMILGGQGDAAEHLLSQAESDPHLDYARALLRQARGENDTALQLFDSVANSRSPFDHARASIHAIELRLSMGLLDSKAAAEALEERLYAWRGDARELAMRLRIVELYRKIGAWRSVFAQLRAVKAAFPGHAAEIDQQLKEAFAAVPRDPALDTMAPTDLIALLEENAELMADGPDGEPMRALLAEKLMALDLPKRADPLLTRLMRAAPYGPGRAGFGATLATVRLREGDGDGALLALSESNSADMPDPVRERRALITARVEAKRGDIAGAVDALSGSKSREADETRATILEQANDWPAARDALMTLAAHVVPDSGTLDDAQLGVLLRLASAAMRAGDDTTLASLRARLRNRLGDGPQADLFRLLTAAPVRGTADLGRARAEMGLARAVAADMNPKKPAAKTP